MYTFGQLASKIGNKLVDIKIGRRSIELEPFMQTNGWSRDLLSDKTDDGICFMNIATGRHSVIAQKPSLPKEEENLPITKQSKPQSVAVRISGEVHILRIICERTHGNRFIPQSYEFEKI